MAAATCAAAAAGQIQELIAGEHPPRTIQKDDEEVEFRAGERHVAAVGGGHRTGGRIGREALYEAGEGD